jgi:hypothetical protein
MLHGRSALDATSSSQHAVAVAIRLCFAVNVILNAAAFCRMKPAWKGFLRRSLARTQSIPLL